MKVEGITWHAVTLEPSKFAQVKQLYAQTFGLTPTMEMDGVAVFQMPNGTLLELYTPQSVPPFGYNDALAFGFRVDDIEQASNEIAAAGGELLGQINRVPEMGYAYRHFRGPDGQVYGLNEQK
ncbi:MAG TPA: VOC family protein [Caulobacteraceae bacterium]|jgi:predicted enzyme related to lactoylglutathione lyase